MVTLTILRARAGDTTASRQAQTELHDLSPGDRRFALIHATQLVQTYGTALKALEAIADRRTT